MPSARADECLVCYSDPHEEEMEAYLRDRTGLAWTGGPGAFFTRVPEAQDGSRLLRHVRERVCPLPGDCGIEGTEASGVYLRPREPRYRTVAEVRAVAVASARIERELEFVICGPCFVVVFSMGNMSAGGLIVDSAGAVVLQRYFTQALQMKAFAAEVTTAWRRCGEMGSS